MNIPTLLTMSRLVVAIAIGLPFLFMSTEAAALLAFVLFGVAAFTDFLDGYLARKWNQVSELGRMLDPIADKAMVLVMLAILLGIFGLVAVLLIPVSIIMFREVLVSGMREFLGDRAKALKVTKIAKWKTASQMVAISILLLSVGLSSATIEGIGFALLWVAAALTLLSGIDYARKAVELLE